MYYLYSTYRTGITRSGTTSVARREYFPPQSQTPRRKLQTALNNGSPRVQTDWHRRIAARDERRRRFRAFTLFFVESEFSR